MDDSASRFKTVDIWTKTSEGLADRHCIAWTIISGEQSVVVADHDGRLYHVTDVRMFWRAGERARVTYGGVAVRYELADGPLLEFVPTIGRGVPVHRSGRTTRIDPRADRASQHGSLSMASKF